MNYLILACLSLLALCSCRELNPLNAALYFSQQADEDYRITEERLQKREQIRIHVTWSQYPPKRPQDLHSVRLPNDYKLTDFTPKQQDAIIDMLREFRQQYNKNIGCQEYILWPHEINRHYVSLIFDNAIHYSLGLKTVMISEGDYTYSRSIKPAEAKLRSLLMGFLIELELKRRKENNEN